MEGIKRVVIQAVIVALLFGSCCLMMADPICDAINANEKRYERKEPKQ